MNSAVRDAHGPAAEATTATTATAATAAATAVAGGTVVDRLPAVPPMSQRQINALLAKLTQPIVFVDLETTGSHPDDDGITEIGLVEISSAGVQTWSTMVDPQRPIPPFIQQLTGISDEMVRGQPTFASLAPALFARLEGKLFVAHNVRFDFGVLKHAFQRQGLAFRADTLCTVRLSRALFPSARKHGLDALITRLGLQPTGRHRALADADLLWQFWRQIHQRLPGANIDKALGALVHRASQASTLDPKVFADVPSLPGVYLFFGKPEKIPPQPLYVGKSIDLRQRVAAHFSGEHHLAVDAQLARDVVRIEHRVCAGEFGAQLLEAQLLKRHAPKHNRPTRQRAAAYSWHFPPAALMPQLTTLQERDFGHTANLYGLFDSRAKAQSRLRQLADEYALCPALLGLDLLKPGQGCFAHRNGRCRGACLGIETAADHDARARDAIKPLYLTPWPHEGAIAFAERHRSGFTQWHVVDNWCYLGSTEEPRALRRIVEGAAPPIFDRDTYAILRRAFQQPGLDILPLRVTAGLTLEASSADIGGDRGQGAGTGTDSDGSSASATLSARNKRANAAPAPAARVPPSRDPVTRARARRAVPASQMAMDFDKSDDA